MDRFHSAAIIVVVALASAPLRAQVSGKSTGDCNYNDGRGWVKCGDYPAGQPQQGAPAGPTHEGLMRRQMLDSAGQLGAAIGAAIGRHLSGQPDRDKAQDLNNRAIAAANGGDWNLALGLTRQALGLVPDDPVLKQNLVVINEQLAEAERARAARAYGQQLRQEDVEREAAARDREAMAQNLGGLKLGRDTAGGGSQWFKNAQPDPELATAAAPSPFKLPEEERRELRDAMPDGAPKDQSLPRPKWEQWKGAPGVVGKYDEEGGSHYLYVSAGTPMWVSVCVAGRAAPLNDKVSTEVVKFRLGSATLPRPEVEVFSRPATQNPAIDACAMRARK